MLENLKKEIKKKYYLDIEIDKKYEKVYVISFTLEDKKISFIYLYDTLSSFEVNLKQLEKRVNEEIINYYIRKEN